MGSVFFIYLFIFPPTGLQHGTRAVQFIYSAFPNVRAASTARQGQSAAASATSTTSAEPARSRGGCSPESHNNNCSISVKRHFISCSGPIGGPSQYPPRPPHTPSSDLLLSSRPGRLALQILAFFCHYFWLKKASATKLGKQTQGKCKK